MAGSLVTLLPLVATVAFLPPCGLLMLLAWRLRRPELFASWAAVPLGLFDDLVSGQPLGSAMAFWTLCVLAIDVLDTRLVWRDFWQDWLIAGGGVAFCLIASRLVASPIAAHVDTALLLQILASCALYPLAAYVCARIDQRRQPRFQ
ncbi:rod shape-determining protein MreD, partial [Sphingomonas sp.]|uniref:rod shape-determining protein MreD n=1 Tax=Sphingomonas sp. TaxID=28214 RepID=UPI002C789477